MAVSRFFSLSLGKYDNFVNKTDGTIAAADTTPDVSLYSLLYNTSTNTITNFDNAEEGQIIHVHNLVSEQLAFSTNVKTADSAGLWGAGDNITFIARGSSFYEISRSTVANPIATAAAGDTTPSVGGKSVLILNSAGLYQISDFDDASEGQELTVINLGVAASLLNDVTKVIIGGSGGALIMASSQAYQLVSYSGVWYLTSSTRNAGLL